MKILMLSWEYPPKSVGGLSTHVYYLAQQLCAKGHEIHLITSEEGNAPTEENDKGVFVYRAEPFSLETDDFTKWVMQINFAMIVLATRIIREKGPFHIIHSHDWLTSYSAITLKLANDIPLISTIHATEYGRNNGIKTEMQRYISNTEWMLCFESWKIIVCSNFMRKQVEDIFHIPNDKICVIPNGVNVNEFEFKADLKEFRRIYAKDEEKIVFYIGRHVFEKGIHLLIEAAEKIINGYENTKFIIGGKGPMTEELKNSVEKKGLTKKVAFVGYLEDEIRNNLYRVSDVAVFPSLYEPFGIVSLEAMSSGCPVVVSDTGGFSEIVQHQTNGLKFHVGSPESLVENIIKILKDEELCKALKNNALKEIYEKYTWNKIAEKTLEVYEVVLKETIGTKWDYNTKQVNL